MRILRILVLPVVVWASPTRRILVATWAPDGGPDKVRLAHGRSDAMDFADAFSELGGVATGDRIVREALDTATLVDAWREASLRMDEAKAQGVATELILFHTGHADPAGMLFGAARIPWERARQFLSQGEGTMRLAFLDACASGSALRTKGGRFHSAIESVASTGVAVLASSRWDELSTESDRDGGSLFTRTLIAGLRGAADSDRDGRVSLSEAFRYSSRETQRRAKELGAPAQHPAGSTELMGTIDPILTDLRHPPARLRLEPGFPAIALRDSLHELFGTLTTAAGDTLDLGLPPGLWILESDSLHAIVRILLRAGETRNVSPLEMVQRATAPPAAIPDTLTRWVPINFGIIPPVSINGADPRRVRNAFSMDLVLAEARTFSGLQFAGVMSRTFGNATGAQVSLAGNTVTGNMAGFQFSNANHIEGSLAGAQLSTYLNLIEGDLRGAQVGGLMSVARGRVQGAQIGIGSAYAGTMDRGVQVSFVSVCGRATGVQTGIINVASRMDGLQVGMVNIGSGTGARIGILNVVPSGRPLSVGALSVGEDIELHPALQIDPDFSQRLLLRSRMGWFQSGLVWQGLPYMDGRRAVSIETSVRMVRTLAAELGLAWNIKGKDAGWTPDLVAGFGWPLLSHLAPFAQASWSMEHQRAKLWAGLEF